MTAKKLSDLEELKNHLEKIHRFATAGLCISSVTHEINNYLGAIMAYAEMLQLETSPGEEIHKMLKKIIESVNHCSQLINGLNTISKQNEELVTLVEVPEIIDTVIMLRRYYLKLKSINIEKHISENLQPIVVSLPKFQLAIIHLLKNAEENLSNEDNNVHKKLIIVSAKKVKEGVTIEIQDNGPTISKDILKNIFSPFMTTKNGIYLGLGLYITKKIAEEHGGTLEYDLQKHSFIMWIPYSNPKTTPKVDKYL